DYGFFYGKQKDTDKAVIFASVATLGRNEYLTEDFFAPDYFDYLVIDEFHHAVNDQYQRIVNYFKPQFLLGLTATPERMDGKNIYEICDYNVPYEISLKEAINKGMLVPFHYYGIYDGIDYSGLHRVKGRYDEKELTDVYIRSTERYDLIYKYYKKYRSKQALGFCCSKKHAEEMAREFCRRGVPSVAVYSNADGEFSEDRDKAIEQLRRQEISVIFSVDMFNEGLDIASVDMVLFLRPTESPIVFLQQLGRGLRTYKGKQYLNVLDFIGNYEKAGKAPLLLGGGKAFSEKKPEDYNDIEYPDDCIVDFDMQLIDLFKEMEKKSLSMRERIRWEFYRVKELLDGKVPTRMELFTYMEDDIYQYCIKHAKENPFRRYMDFLNEINELSPEEKLVYSGIGREFLALIETTDMQKVYKMPILYSFYNNGSVRMAVTEAEVLESWKKFFNTGKNWKDFAADITYSDYITMTDKQHLSKAKNMPIKFLKSSGKGFFIEKKGYALGIRDDLKEMIDNEAFGKHMKDILEYRTIEYYRRRYAESVWN
ncbi:MAG: DEAD/DEAH box helicase, partial [Lachnospiraceae bacterium]|nr:DEAD/DEAH box helicase [Lachnospiraceae bacterium]